VAHLLLYNCYKPYEVNIMKQHDENNVNSKVKKTSKLKKAAIKLLTFLVIIYSIIFTGDILKNIGSPFFIPRSCMSIAESITYFQILPLSKIFGVNNPLTIPFYLVRDGLYYTGRFFYPKGEGEKEIWWYRIKWAEYITIIHPEVLNYCLYWRRNNIFFNKNSLKCWDNELYNHIKPFAKAKISDPKFRKEKFTDFISLIRTSIGLTEMTYDAVIVEVDVKRGIHNPAFFDEKHAQKYDKVYKIYEQLKKYSYQSERDSYDYFFKNPKYYESEIKYDLSKKIVAVKYVENKLSCDDPYLFIMAKSHKELNDYYNTHTGKLSYGDGVSLSAISVGIEGFEQKFRKCSVLNDYFKYFDEKAKRLGIKK
jgi:hypothetical protein